MPRFALLALAATALLSGCGAKRAITGTVIGTDGQPLDNAIVRLDPGQVELVTDRQGQFSIDYLREGGSSRSSLSKRQNYTLDVFKPGFGIEQREFYYKTGEHAVGVITLTPEVLRVQDDGQNLVPSLQAEQTATSGTTYEGQ